MNNILNNRHPFYGWFLFQLCDYQFNALLFSEESALLENNGALCYN